MRSRVCRREASRSIKVDAGGAASQPKKLPGQADVAARARLRTNEREHPLDCSNHGRVASWTGARLHAVSGKPATAAMALQPPLWYRERQGRQVEVDSFVVAHAVIAITRIVKERMQRATTATATTSFKSSRTPRVHDIACFGRRTKWEHESIMVAEQAFF